MSRALQTQYNAAVADVQAVVAQIRALPENASRSQIDSLQRDLQVATTEAERTQANLENSGELESVSKRFIAQPVQGGGRPDAEWRTFSHGESIADHFAARSVGDDDLQRGSLGRMLRGMATGNWRGAELEQRALGTATGSAGGFIVPDILAGQFIDLARAKMVTSAAGVRVLPLEKDAFGSYTIAKLTADPSTAWVAEAGTITPSDPTFGAVVIDPGKLACLVRVSRELLSDAPNAAEILQRTLAAAFGAEMDRAVLEGSGVGAEPGGLASIAGLGEESMGDNGAVPTNDTGPAKLAATVLKVRQANHEPTAIISSPRQWSLFHNLKDGQKQPLRFGAGLDELNWYQTSNCSDAITQGSSGAAGNVYTGDFTKGILAVRQGIEIYITRDAYLTTDEVAFLVTTRADFQAEDDGAFARLIGVTAS